MNELSWTATRTTTIDQFQGQTPRPEDEAPIIDVFEQHPQLVLRAIDETAAALAEGKITWAWSVLRTRLERGTTAIREATANTGSDKARHIRNAEAFIHNAGIHYDRESDVEAELFGDDYSRGRLHDYQDDDSLRARLLTLWAEQRPRGEQAERDHTAYSERCKANRIIVLELKKKHLAELAAKAETHQPSTPTAGELETDLEPEPETEQLVTVPADPDDDIPW